MQHVPKCIGTVARTRRRRSAFTLVELLVAMTIISILMSLMLPAVQTTRETARKIYCQNNLHQLGLAVQNYQSANGDMLPPAGMVSPDPVGYWCEIDLRSGNSLSWAVMLLPYLELDTVYRQFDFAKTAFDQPLDPQMSQPSVLLCPSDAARGRFFVDGTFTKGKVFGKANYAAFVSPFHTDVQILYPGAISLAAGSTVQSPRGQRSADISDGLSNTLMLSEVRTRDHEQDQRGAWALPWTGSSILALDIHDKQEWKTYPHGYTPNPRYNCAQVPNNDGRNPNVDVLYLDPDQQATQMDHMPCVQWDPTFFGMEHYLSAAPRSLHPRGVNAVFADGHVAFLLNEINDVAMAYLISINDGQNIDPSEHSR
jgi:prepilin-type N-terminal cleavage/methylation domain-containing protein/prepilin-type processing-associated H-X9-DG protein